MHLFTAVKMGHLAFNKQYRKSVLISLTGPVICFVFNHSLPDGLGLEVVDPYKV